MDDPCPFGAKDGEFDEQIVMDSPENIAACQKIEDMLAMAVSDHTHGTSESLELYCGKRINNTIFFGGKAARMCLDIPPHLPVDCSWLYDINDPDYVIASRPQPPFQMAFPTVDQFIESPDLLEEWVRVASLPTRVIIIAHKDK